MVLFEKAPSPCGSACCGLVCGSPYGSPMWGGGKFRHGLVEKSLKEVCQWLRSRSDKTKQRPIHEPFLEKEVCHFSDFGVFFLEIRGELTKKNLKFSNCNGFCEFSLLSQSPHLIHRNTPFSRIGLFWTPERHWTRTQAPVTHKAKTRKTKRINDIKKEFSSQDSRTCSS